MVVGSTIKDIEKVKTPTTQELRAESQAEGNASTWYLNEKHGSVEEYCSFLLIFVNHSCLL